MFRLIIIFLFCGFICNSQNLNKNLVVISEDGSKFILYVDGEKVNNEPQANIKAFNVSEGWVKLKAEFVKDNIAISDSIHILAIEKNNLKEITYSIKSTSGKFRFVSIGDLSGPKTPPVAEAPVDKGPVIDNNLYGHLYKAKDNKPVFFKNYNDSLKQCTVLLDSNDIKYAKNLVNKSNDIHNKYKYVEDIIERNCYSVHQLIPLLNLLEVELDKLKLAKKAYSHTLDRNNNKLIVEIFNFKSVKETYEYFLFESANIEHQLSLKCSVPSSENKILEIITTIKKESYEHDKLRVAKEQIVNNCLNTAQVKKILDIFNHDRERMDFVKSAYNVTIDKENFKTLEEFFQFSENKKDFLIFLSQ